MKGLVVKTTGSWIQVRTPAGDKIECKLKGQFKIHGKKSTNPVAVGDRVEFFMQDSENIGVITCIEERYNYIIRKSINLSKFYQVIAANLDQVFLIVTAAFPRTSPGFIDRFLTTAEAYHIPAGLIFNKIDIYHEEVEDYHQLLSAIYSKVDYPCLNVSALTGENLGMLLDWLKGKTTLFSGHSGVGKSALINALQPGLDLKVGKISDYHNKGKHTTTFAEMVELNNGGFIIDTPGIREFGLTDFKKEEVAERFPEFRALMHNCQFSNCTHTHEPNCAVKKALDENQISPSRYRSYLAIVNDEGLEKNDWD
ncbi:MAG: ribosome small subunit-dependent GTPase A [Bacteroidetes bacterium]|nr:ribosome small subunit-dependent GTPase A [Bacteroidota bacterium]